jgi:hypothetical protein
MCKCIKARFLPLHTLKNIVLKNFIQVVWKYAQMQQNTFTTTSDVKNFFFKNLILVVWTLKNIFLKNLILVVSKYAQMHQNTYITTTDVK